MQPYNLGSGKCRNIYSIIGKTPVFAFGNTDGDFEMLQYALSSKYKNLAFILNHDDSVREYDLMPKQRNIGQKKLNNTDGVLSV